MNRRELILSGAATALGGCNREPPESWLLRYRLKIAFAAGGNTYEGESVLETLFRRVSELSLNQTQSFYGATDGDAVFIGLPGGQALVAAFGQVFGTGGGSFFNPSAERALTKVVPEHEENLANREASAPYDALVALRGPRVLPPGHWPTFLYFSDVNDIRTARIAPLPQQRFEVLGTVPQKPVSEILGDDVRLTTLTIERTEAPVSRQIETLLPWVADIPGAEGLAIQRSQSPLHENLIYSNFRLKELERQRARGA